MKPQSDADFVAAVAATSTLVLPLRRMIAAFGNVEIELVRSDVTFDDLDIGPADSIDELDLILRLEAVLGFELTESEKVQIPSPDSTRKLLVGRFIRAACAVAAARVAA